MHTLGYRFRPWTAAKSIADGASILDYIRSTATESGIDAHIRFGHRVVAADWSAATSTWRVKVIAGKPPGSSSAHSWSCARATTPTMPATPLN